MSLKENLRGSACEFGHIWLIFKIRDFLNRPNIKVQTKHIQNDKNITISISEWPGESARKSERPPAYYYSVHCIANESIII